VYRIEGSRAPRIGVAGVVNAASLEPGIVPGSLATVYAAGVLDDPGNLTAPDLPLPPELSGVSVTVAGIGAPVYILANANGQEQVTFQIPFEVAGRSSAPVVVTRTGQSSAPVDTPVFALQPAIYTSDGQQAIVVHASDNTLVTTSQPLEHGEYAYLYAEGLGAVSNQPPDGAAGPDSPLASALTDVVVTLASAPCEVQFAGLAPGLAGVYQVNFRVPPDAPGGSQPITLAAGSASSPVATAPVR